MLLSGIVIAKNEEQMIGDCLVSLEFCDEIIVVDSGSTDNTIEIAQDHGARVIKSIANNYAQWRNDGIKAAKGDWILFLDADERITPQLRKEIAETIPTSDAVYEIPRQNIYLGRPMEHGGWDHERVIRLFPKNKIKRYVNELHEQPEYDGELKSLTANMTHFSHRDLSSMLEKTLFFTKYETDLRLKGNHPKMSTWRFVRVMLTEFYYRFIKLSAWKDGTEGIIDGLFQVSNTFIIYARLWEAQLKS